MVGSNKEDSARGFRGDIQGLRALAVLSVVLYHAGLPFLPGGYVGVDVFFVISGFLITSHLLSSLRRDGKVSFAAFYAKRARRILPASFVVLGLSLLAAVIWYPPLLMREVWKGAVATALYVPNYFFATEGTDYLAEKTPSLFQHYWSLGIEEQFYLFWPILLVAGSLLVRRAAPMFLLVLGIVLGSFALCVWLTFESQPWAFFSLPTRAWELGIGGLAAFLLSFRRTPITGVWAAVTGWAGVLGILASVLLFTSATPFPGYMAAIPAISTALVIIAGAAESLAGPSRVLSLRPMMWIGTISYSLYLVHWPMLLVPQAAVGFDEPLPLWTTFGLALACVPLAWLMYRFVEEPGRNATWLTSARPRRTLLTAGAASLALVLGATGTYYLSNSRPLYIARDVAPSAIATPPDATAFVPQNLDPSLRAASADQPIIYDECHVDQASASLTNCIYGDPQDPRIVLFGDSHAAQWFPAVQQFALANGYSLEPQTKSSCPSVSGEMLNDGVPYTSCDEWRGAVIDRINVEKPALVLISNRGGSAGFVSGDLSRDDAWALALRKTLDQLAVPVAIVADTPDLGDPPSICLSANLGSAVDCGEERSMALSRTMQSVEQQVAEEESVELVDLTDYICDQDWCPPILGNTLVYRDGNHITATFSEELGGVMSERLAALLGGTKQDNF